MPQLDQDFIWLPCLIYPEVQKDKWVSLSLRAPQWWLTQGSSWWQGLGKGQGSSPGGILVFCLLGAFGAYAFFCLYFIPDPSIFKKSSQFPPMEHVALSCCWWAVTEQTSAPLGTLGASEISPPWKGLGGQGTWIIFYTCLLCLTANVCIPV